MKYYTALCLYLFFSINCYAISDNCSSVISSSASDITIRVGGNRAITSLAGGLDCASEVASAYNNINRIIIRFDTGVYRQSKSVVYPPVLSTWPGAVYIAPAENATVTFSGATSVTGITAQGNKRYIGTVPSSSYYAMLANWTRESHDEKTIAPPKIIMAGVPMHLARTPDGGYAKIVSVDDTDSQLFTYGGATLATYTGSSFIHGFFANDWADSVIYVANHDLLAKQIRLSSLPKYGVKTGGRFYLEGSPSFVDSEMEYAASPTFGRVLFYYSGSVLPTVEITRATSILEGDNVNNLFVKNVRLESVRGAALNLTGNNISLDNVVVQNTGLDGVKLSGYNNVVKNSSFKYIGATGVNISGGDRYSLAPAKAIVSNNNISTYGLDVLTYVQGILMDGVGIQALNNIISNSPDAGILFIGNDHVIRGNEIYDVVKDTGDQGAIYSGRSWIGQGTVIQDNFIHHVYGIGSLAASAIYLDDQASGVTVSKNVIANVFRGINVGGGRRNAIINNLVVNATYKCMTFDDRGLTWQAYAVQPGGVLYEELKGYPYQSLPYTSRYPGIELLPDDRPGVPVDNIVKNNIGSCAWSVADSAISQGNSLIQNNLVNPEAWLANPSVLTDGSYAPVKSDYFIDWGTVFSD